MDTTQETSTALSEKPRKPQWLRVKLPTGEEYIKVRNIVDKHKLHTICQSGNCPNMGECWGAGTATFMILGNVCTRSCGFCSVFTGRPLPAGWDEPMRVANSVKLMGVKHCVITSVDRDDLKDGGSIIWAETIKAIRKESPATKFETLIPDFAGHWENLQRSLEVLKRVKEAGIRTKSGIMVGLGEKEEEVLQAMDDLRSVNCDVITIGQYLQPTPKNLPVKEFIHPDQFERYRLAAVAKGFLYVESGPLIRSSYHAERHVL